MIAPRVWAQTPPAGSQPAAPPSLEEMVAAQRKKKGPPLEESMVRDLVAYAHSDLEKVKAIIGQQPKIVNCVFDWGGGDYETALGAASHMGRRDIALHLLANNARLDIFAATMLGKLDIVKASLAAFPDALNTPGPHGIPLIKHAEMGGDEAKTVLEFLQTLVK